MRILVPAALVVLALVSSAQPAAACATCFGAEDSALTRGMNSAILTLLGIVAVVQLGCAAAFVAFIIRSRRLRERKERFRVIRGGAS